MGMIIHYRIKVNHCHWLYICIDKSENRVAVLLTLSAETAHDNALARKWIMPN